ncbi:MAG: ATP-binding protein, partial [Paracoccaceae bacterium]
GSETQLMIFFQNLVLNALTFVRPGVDPCVHVAVEDSKKENSVVISVHDNGIGIAEDHFDQIFQMFKKLKADPHDESSGLGLAICRRIALSHQTSISMTSQVGEGSTFSIELDLA